MPSQALEKKSSTRAKTLLHEKENKKTESSSILLSMLTIGDLFEKTVFYQLIFKVIFYIMLKTNSRNTDRDLCSEDIDQQQFLETASWPSFFRFS